MASCIHYVTGGDVELVDLLEQEIVDEDDGMAILEADDAIAMLPEPALLYRSPDPAAAVPIRLIRPWPETTKGFQIHFAITPLVPDYERSIVARSLTRALWASYSNPQTGLVERIGQIERQMLNEMVDPALKPRLESLVQHMHRLYFARTRRKNADGHGYVDTTPSNFIVEMTDGDTSIPFEKKSGCDHQDWSLFVAHIPSPHAAIYVARRLASSYRRLVNETYTTRLLLPLSHPIRAYAVVAPVAASRGHLIDAYIWQQLPIWRQGVEFTLTPGTIPDFFDGIVHVLPPHILDMRPAMVDAKPVDTGKKNELLFGDLPAPERDRTILAKISQEKKKAVKKGKKETVVTSPRSAFKLDKYIAQARRNYAPRPSGQLGDAYSTPMTLAILESTGQHLAAQDDRVVVLRAPKDSQKKAEAMRIADGKLKLHKVDEMLRAAAAKRPQVAMAEVAEQPPAKKPRRDDLRSYFTSSTMV